MNDRRTNPMDDLAPQQEKDGGTPEQTAPEGATARGGGTKSTLKEERDAVLMYLPPELAHELTLTFKKLDVAMSEDPDRVVGKFGKNRHFYPEVIRQGLEAVGIEDFTEPIEDGGPDQEGALDLNEATAEELAELPGVGPALAEGIIEHRQETGGFSAVDELLEVSGVGDARLEEIRPRITV